MTEPTDYCNFCGTRLRAWMWLICVDCWAERSFCRDLWDRSVVFIQGVQVDSEMRPYAPVEEWRPHRILHLIPPRGWLEFVQTRPDLQNWKENWKERAYRA